MCSSANTRESREGAVNIHVDLDTFESECVFVRVNVVRLCVCMFVWIIYDRQIKSIRSLYIVWLHKMMSTFKVWMLFCN